MDTRITFFIYEHATVIMLVVVWWFFFSFFLTILWAIYRHYEKKRVAYYDIDIWGPYARGTDFTGFGESDLSNMPGEIRETVPDALWGPNGAPGTFESQ